jgi:hypothetical protein
MVQLLADTRGFSLLRGVPGVFPRDEIINSPTYVTKVMNNYSNTAFIA